MSLGKPVVVITFTGCIPVAGFCCPLVVTDQHYTTQSLSFSNNFLLVLLVLSVFFVIFIVYLRILVQIPH